MMVLQLIQHPQFKSIQAGSFLELTTADGLQIAAYPYESYEDSSLCLLNARLPSKSIKTMTLNKISLPSNIEHPIIVRADFVIKALSWACLSQHSPLLILELDQSSILELRPSTYWVDPRRCFSYEIASPILAETKKVPCRCIGPQLGCIPTLDDLLERWKNLPYSFWPS